MSDSAVNDLGAVQYLETEAIGEPGQRRFRIRVTSEAGSASLWLEKEQVRALSEAIQQVLAQNRQEDDGRRPSAPALEPFPLNPDHDFQVGRLALAYDDHADALALYVTDIERAQETRATIRATFTRAQARIFSAQAEVTIEAGRAVCPLCKVPLDGYDHLCPPTNGHSDDILAWIPPPELG
jgi:uncharacterized repeat protein (TIGR03847 family)